MAYPPNGGYPPQGYPTNQNQAAYPPQQKMSQYPQAPVQSTQYGYPPQAQYGYPQAAPGSLPGQQAVYQTTTTHVQYGSPPPPYSYNVATGPAPYPGNQPGVAYPSQSPVQMVAGGSYDQCARFGAGSSHNIPPPPPGAMPTAAQMAASQGQPVVMRQSKESWLSGAPGGGYTFW